MEQVFVENKSDEAIYKKLAAKYLKSAERYRELHRIVQIMVDGLEGCLKEKQKEVNTLICKRNDLLAACKDMIRALSNSNPDADEEVTGAESKMQQAIAKAEE